MTSHNSLKQRVKSGATIVSGAFLLLSLVVSLSAFALFNDGQVDRVLFFPGARTARVSGELRSLPALGDTRDDLRLLLNEVILGPAEIQHGRLVPRGTQVRSLIVNDGIAFVNFNEVILFEAPDQQLALEEVFDVLRRTIRYNFRSIERVVFTVNGQLPSQPFFQISPPPEVEPVETP